LMVRTFAEGTWEFLSCGPPAESIFAGILVVTFPGPDMLEKIVWLDFGR
jgi:hypothetical protein